MSEIDTNGGIDLMESVVTQKLAMIPSLQTKRPASKTDLMLYCESFLNLDVPSKKICPNHCAPIDYLWHAFAADRVAQPPGGMARCAAWPCSSSSLTKHPVSSTQHPVGNADCILWANRGGGKTQLAAVATLLDCIFKPDCQVRILGGSLEQSKRMYEYLLTFVDSNFTDMINDRAYVGKCKFKNKSRVEVLTQSSRNVRGRHVQKLRCDEVELFDQNVFTAAQFVPHTKNGILASMEIISTMHRPYGLMQKCVTEAAARGTPIFKWCMWEVIEKCTDRTCSQCPLCGDCQGKAKNAAGFLKIDDAIAQMQRSSRAAWESEMLCLRPSLENSVFADFDPDIHVRPLEYNHNLPLYRAIDFGFINPFVCLWIQVDSDGIVRVIDEYIRSRATIDIHAAYILDWRGQAQHARGSSFLNPQPATRNSQPIATYCDPAGSGVNDVNGSSAVRELRKFGINCRHRRSSVLEGIELIRRALKDGSGKSTLIISPRCKHLIEAFRCYHYPDDSIAELPLKDGLYDHPIDALRYFFVNRFGRSSNVIEIRY
jgi:hypothetical protein